MSSELSTIGSTGLYIGTPEVQAAAGVTQAIVSVVTAFRAQRSINSAQLVQVQIKAKQARAICAANAIGSFYLASFAQIDMLSREILTYESGGRCSPRAISFMYDQLEQAGLALGRLASRFEAELY